MRVRLRSRAGQQGNVMLTSLIVLTIIGTTLAYSLSRVQTATRLTNRSQDWNACIGLAEAGVEEGLAHLQQNYTNRASQGWTFVNGRYALKRTLGSDYFEVNILSNASPTITRATNRVTSTGCIYLPSTAKFLCRTVAVDMVTTISPPLGMVARNRVKMNGNRSMVDSYDSSDPTKSTGGVYDAAKRQANATVGCVSGNFDLGNGDVFGKLVQGPGVLGVTIHKNGAVGNLAWHAGGNSGIQPGASSVDLNLAAPDVTEPFSSAPAPPAMAVGGVNYDAVLDDGNYLVSSSFIGKILVRGKSVLYVKDFIWMPTAATPLKLDPGATLEIFVGGTFATIKSVQMTPGTGSLLAIHGFPSVTLVEVDNGPGKPCYINAPNADFDLDGNAEFYGAAVCKEFGAGGNPAFHFDEAIRAYYSKPKFSMISWMEP